MTNITDVYEFIILVSGIGSISATSRLGLGDMLTLSRKTPEGSAQAEDDDRPRGCPIVETERRKVVDYQ